MGILTKEIRPVHKRALFMRALSDPVQVFGRRIHLACYVVSNLFGVYRSFIMNREFGTGFDKSRHLILAGMPAGFVSQAPHDNGRMIFVPFKHLLSPSHVVGSPFAVFADPA